MGFLKRDGDDDAKQAQVEDPFFALGTAVVPVREDHPIEKPAMVLPLTG
jgi:hypothetical protein